MDFSDPAQRAVFFQVHAGLPREGPGNFESTRRALALTGQDSSGREPVRVVDVACGPGQQTLDLARLLPRSTIVALDLHEPFLREVSRRAAAADATARVMPVRADMSRLPVAPASVDLLWCEGAAYIIGVGNALAAWWRVLRDGAAVAFTEAVWLRDDAPAEVRACWSEYPGMGDAAATRALIRAQGFELRGDFLLPPSAWWDDYYRPMAQRLDALTPRYRTDRTAMGVLDECRQEIEVYRRHSDCYGYVFFVAAKPG